MIMQIRLGIELNVVISLTLTPSCRVWDLHPIDIEHTTHTIVPEIPANCYTIGKLALPAVLFYSIPARK